MCDVTVDRVLQSVAADICVDRTVLATLLRDRPGPHALVPLLSVPAVQVVRAAVVYLGLYGSLSDCPLLVLCLQHKDDDVARLAEHCLWGIWMRSGSNVGNRNLTDAIDCIKDADYTRAAAVLRLLVAEEPSFAEAHFQHGIALCFLDQPDRAARAYRETLRLNPYQFAAAAALGHVNVELGNLAGALRYYRRALRIHPRLQDVHEAVQQVEEIVSPD